MVAAGDTYFVKPLLRNFQYGTEYYVLELGNDRFSWVKGDRTHVERQQLPQEVHDFFSELFANSDDIAADARKGEKGALTTSRWRATWASTTTISPATR